MTQQNDDRTPDEQDDDDSSVLRFRFNGEEYELDLESLTVVETRLAKRRFKVTYRQILRGIAELDGDAIAAIIYLAANRTDKPVKSEQLDSVQPLQFVTHDLIEDENAEKPSRDDLQDMVAMLEDGDEDPTG